MAGNTFGELFKIITFGESHGKAVGVVIDGVIPNIPIDINEIQKELDKRKPGTNSIITSRKEEDRVEILSGVFEGKSTGTPICMLIWNKSQDPKAYEKIKNIFRPGHAGYTFIKKYGIYDYRGGGRASGRETIGRVAAAAIAKTMLREYGIQVLGYTKKIGTIETKKVNLSLIDKNDIKCPDETTAKKMVALIKKLKQKGDSVGGIIEILIKGSPVGLGDPVFDKLNSDIAKAILSIGAVKGIEFGEGFKLSEGKASKVNDEFYFDKKSNKIRTYTNRQGGILGGISNGENIIVRIAIKPTSSILIEKRTVDYNHKSTKIKVGGRHDTCLCPRIIPVAESMIALVLIDKILKQQMIQKGKTLNELRQNIDFLDKNILLLLAERQKICKLIGEEKAKTNKPIFDKKREETVLNKRKAFAKRLSLNTHFIETFYKSLFSISKNVQIKTNKNNNK
jgi:chorismate synthase